MLAATEDSFFIEEKMWRRRPKMLISILISRHFPSYNYNFVKLRVLREH